MADSTGTPKFQWKWLLISLLMYVVFYFLVLSIMGGGILSGQMAARIWAIVGVFVIAAIAGYISKGVTIWEPVSAAIIIAVLWYIASELDFNVAVPIGKPVITLVVIFVFAFCGAWLGERIQRSKDAKKAAPAPTE